MKKKAIILIIVILFILFIGIFGIMGKKDKDSYDSSESPEPTDGSYDAEDSGTFKESGKKTDGKTSTQKETEKIQTSINKYRNEVQITSQIVETQTGEHKSRQGIKLRNIEAVSDLGLEKEKDTKKIKTRLSNGIKAEIKIMPNTASKIALSRLRSQNRTLELKEVGKDKNLSVVYASEANKTTRFLGLFKVKYKLKIEIDAQTGEIIKLHGPWWRFLAKDLEEPEVENMALQLIKPIQDITLIKNTEKTLDLDEYFLNAESYSVSEVENIDLTLDESRLTLVPEINYTGINSVALTAYSGNESLETMFNIVVSEENLSIQTVQYPAILGEKVRWKKIIKAKEKTRIDLPYQSENITVIQLDEGEKIINKKEVTEKLVEIEGDKNVNFYEIEYYTPSPYSIEKSFVGTRKQISVHGPEDIYYVDVLAFDYLPVEASAEAVKLYLITEEGREEIKTEKYDLNENNLVDYIEWIIPSLNNQNYEVIIEIAKAEHLDSDRNFISDIYEEVYKLDDIWSETIPSGDYVRVTFKTELDNTRDIKLYPRIVIGNPKIEVYEVDGTEVIAELTSINSNTYNQILLTNLEGTQDTFDLRIVGGDLEIDHIIDPSVTLVSPLDNTHSSNSTQIFNCSANDESMLANITLYGNWSGGWHANETKDVTGTSNSTTFTKTLSDGDYIWNCLVYDNDSNPAWFANNYSLLIDSSYPLIDYTTGTAADNANLSQSNIYVNTSVTETNEDTITFLLHNSTGEVNETSFTDKTRNINWTNLADGVYTYNVTVNDTAENSNTTATRTITLDTTDPGISFSCSPSPVHVGVTVTCSCSGSDSTSGIQTISYDANPSTSNKGTFTETCTITDYAGNSVVSSATYVVSDGGGGYPNYRVSSQDLSQGYTKIMRKNWKMNFDIENETHTLLVEGVGSDSISVSLSSVSQDAVLDTGDEKKFELTNDNYYDLIVTLNSIENGNANITIKSIHEEIPVEEEKVEKSYWWIWAILIILLIVIIIVINQKKLKKYFKK